MAGSHESRGIPRSSARMLFIVSSNVDKVDPATRKLIRSRVMRGKNKKRGRPATDSQTTNFIPAAPIKLEEVIDTYVPLFPGRIGSDLSFVEFADEVEPSVLLNMIKVSPVAMTICNPLIVATGFQVNSKESLSPFGLDAAALHITAFAVEGFIHKILRRHPKSISPAALLHFHKGLRLLRGRLVGEDDEEKISDSTIAMVLKLACNARFDGDFQTSRHHMEGVRRMVDLRGGLNTLESKKLLVEMFRCDLSIALFNSSNPVFFCQPSEQLMEYHESLLLASDDKLYSLENDELIQQLNSDLATAWQVMRRFSTLVNLGTQTQRFISLEMILDTMTTVIYRLLRMSFVADSIDEIVRLGLLAFSHHVFLQWKDIRFPFYDFPSVYQNCVLAAKLVDGVSSQLMLWLLMTGANSLFDISEEAWLRESLQDYAEKCHVTTWRDMQEILKSFMWIALLDDQPGKQIYDSLYLDGK